MSVLQGLGTAEEEEGKDEEAVNHPLQKHGVEVVAGIVVTSLRQRARSFPCQPRPQVQAT